MDRRHFIKLGAFGSLISGSALPALSTPQAAPDASQTGNAFDIVVVGGTPAGIMAAIAAARLGSTVALTEYHGHLGGMSTSGLGKSDIEKKETVSALFREFTERVYRYYVDKYGKDSPNVTLCRKGYYYEPSVAERVFNQMIQEARTITVLVGHQLEKAVLKANTVTAAVFTNRATAKPVTLRARMFVDATYEGDLYARAGAAFRIGREAKSEFNEEHAGEIFFDYNENTFLAGSTGKGDKKLPAYTYRLCLTDDPANSYVMKQPPAGYNRNHYLKYFSDLAEGRLAGPKVFREGHGYYKAHFNTMLRVFSFAEIPNRKYDVNINPRPLGFPFPEENAGYVEASWKDREKLFQHHRALAIGLLYFIQNDEDVSAEHREMARKYHLPLDEFTDNEHFPWQLYVREARRLKGLYTLTENDLTIQKGTQRTPVFTDSVITGEYPVDSFPTSKTPSADKKVLEGYIGILPIPTYQIPLRVLIPEKIQGLIVPVAASTSHVAYSTLRMEPLWMGIGQAAGTAAHLAIKHRTEVRNIPVSILQKNLIQQKQLITYFDDIDTNDKAFEAAQFWGTKGFFTSYKACLHEPLSAADFKNWLNIVATLVKNKSVDTSAAGQETVSLAAFQKIIAPLKTDNKAVSIPAWMYQDRDSSQPVLRGEACLALYLYTQDMLMKVR
ncbi:FAD-dependent oxidoreductase [Larkinella bovis]|uniref:FAD-dependent oxidoreductase n=1 Tax=Larkinella bovis TaxID=683041 RepID=A0ABW0IE59_9BACT